jgi:hypothetical protein
MIEHTLDTEHAILYLQPKSAIEQGGRGSSLEEQVS